MNNYSIGGRIGRIGGLALAFATAIGITACASTPPPVAELAVSKAAVAEAVSAGGPELAPAQMQTARDKLDRANLAMAAKDYGKALSLAQEAQADAQLASSQAHTAKARKAASELSEGSRVLREEIERKAK